VISTPATHRNEVLLSWREVIFGVRL